jgi:hypothetical protein
MMNKLLANFHGVCLVGGCIARRFRDRIRSFGLTVKQIEGLPERSEEVWAFITHF